ncbi:PepSY-like domain-containing protein [Maribacter arenosus]|uniref:PepSY-like domain-containing protein n=1 Tax=Maribacter arenosus TaxID=1854708 RepID=A0ABR7VB13_9FLAO|nr:PepSY-like domain-containing protein [Maribacter arenosus]MBD0850081.1 PepSY-like domain-containing protein [Maribacter arenosus]
MSISLKRLFKYKKTIVNPLVQRSFNLKFPKATHIFWQQIDVFKWHVNFRWKKNKCTALFNSEGEWLETVTLVSLDKIPERLQLTLDEKTNKEELRQIYHVQTPDRSLYELNLNNGRYTFRLLYDLSGEIIGKFIL